MFAQRISIRASRRVDFAVSGLHVVAALGVALASSYAALHIFIRIFACAIALVVIFWRWRGWWRTRTLGDAQLLIQSDGQAVVQFDPIRPEHSLQVMSARKLPRCIALKVGFSAVSRSTKNDSDRNNHTKHLKKHLILLGQDTISDDAWSKLNAWVVWLNR
jgi:hypothetical protein